MSENTQKSKKARSTSERSGCLAICLVAAICLAVFYLYNSYLEYTFRKALEKEGRAIYGICQRAGACPDVPEGWARSGLGMEFAGTAKLIGTTRKQTVQYLLSQDKTRFRLCRWTAMEGMSKCYGGGINEKPGWEK